MYKVVSEIKPEKVEMRVTFAEVMDELAANDPAVAYFDCDVINSTGMVKFCEKYPERGVDCGIQEANMISVAAGASAVGMKPFTQTFGPFAARRVIDQVYISAAYAKLNVRMFGCDAGVTASYIATYEVKDGAITFVSNVSADAAAAPAKAPARVAEVASVKSTDVFYFDGSKWSVPDNVIAISDAQCIEITGRYNTLTAAQADANLPIFLKVNYPYATADTQKYVVYNEYKTGYVARQYIYDGSEWAENDGIEQTTLQFVRKDGQWLADPSVVITLPIGKNQELSMQYYQACCDWVYENIDVPLGSTSITSGFGYVTSFGNNEYYTGASAYQGNVDLRADKAVAQYPDGYAGMSDAEVVALMKKRFEEEVMPAVLAKFHPDLAPMDGVQVTLTLVFGTYDGSNRTETARWEVVAPGEFKFLDCTWNKAE